jgi:hypothetical protein
VFALFDDLTQVEVAFFLTPEQSLESETKPFWRMGGAERKSQR